MGGDGAEIAMEKGRGRGIWLVSFFSSAAFFFVMKQGRESMVGR